MRRMAGKPGLPHSSYKLRSAFCFKNKWCHSIECLCHVLERRTFRAHTALTGFIDRTRFNNSPNTLTRRDASCLLKSGGSLQFY